MPSSVANIFYMMALPGMFPMEKPYAGCEPCIIVAFFRALL